MAKWVPCTDMAASKEPLWINLDRVTHMQVSVDRTRLHLENGKLLDVRDTPESILKRSEQGWGER